MGLVEALLCRSRWGPGDRPGQGHEKNSEVLWLNTRLQRGAEGCGGWGLVGRGWSERRDGRGGAHSGTLQPGLQGEPRPLLRARYLVPKSGGQPGPFMEPQVLLVDTGRVGSNSPQPLAGHAGRGAEVRCRGPRPRGTRRCPQVQGEGRVVLLSRVWGPELRGEGTELREGLEEPWREHSEGERVVCQDGF